MVSWRCLPQAQHGCRPAGRASSCPHPPPTNCCCHPTCHLSPNLLCAGPKSLRGARPKPPLEYNEQQVLAATALHSAAWHATTLRVLHELRCGGAAHGLCCSCHASGAMWCCSWAVCSWAVWWGGGARGRGCCWVGGMGGWRVASMINDWSCTRTRNSTSVVASRGAGHTVSPPPPLPQATSPCCAQGCGPQLLPHHCDGLWGRVWHRRAGCAAGEVGFI